MGKEIIRQKNLGRFLGGFYDTFTRASIVITAMNTFMIAGTFYYTGSVEVFRAWFPWLTYQLFMLATVFFVLIGMLLVYLFLTPSSFSYWSDQFYRHDNPLRKDIEMIKKHLGITDEPE